VKKTSTLCAAIALILLLFVACACRHANQSADSGPGSDTQSETRFLGGFPLSADSVTGLIIDNAFHLSKMFRIIETADIEEITGVIEYLNSLELSELYRRPEGVGMSGPALPTTIEITGVFDSVNNDVTTVTVIMHSDHISVGHGLEYCLDDSIVLAFRKVIGDVMLNRLWSETPEAMTRGEVVSVTERPDNVVRAFTVKTENGSEVAFYTEDIVYRGTEFIYVSYGSSYYSGEPWKVLAPGDFVDVEVDDENEVKVIFVAR